MVTFIILPVLCAVSVSAQAAQVLEDGAAGETVMVLTRRLVELGFITESKDVYDERVISAVGDFQTANGLERTGIADIPTQQMMNNDEVRTREEYIIAFSEKYDGMALASGSTGEEVKKMQTRLGELGYYEYKPDGKFGEGTRRAVINYQHANGLEDTGVADESMFIRLYEGESVSYDDYVTSQCAVRGDSGMNVRDIQHRLIELGYFTGEATGTYGENTARAVSRFQYDNGIAQSGNVNFETYEALFSPAAQAAQDDGTLYPGDEGDKVSDMQEQLGELGYYSAEVTGKYDHETEIAVMLFRSANGFTVSQNAGPDVLEVLYSGKAKDASQTENSAAALNENDVDTVCELALEMGGQQFGVDTEPYAGYMFIRYLYAHCGVDIGDPAWAVDNLSDADVTVNDMAKGNIVVLGRKRSGETVVRFALCIGNGKLAYVNEITGVVEINSLDSIDHSSIYVWQVGN